MDLGSRGIYYPCSENKGADFVFAYAKRRFSHDTAHIEFTLFVFFRLFNFRKKISDRDICQHMVAKDHPVYIDKVNDEVWVNNMKPGLLNVEINLILFLR